MINCLHDPVPKPNANKKTMLLQNRAEPCRTVPNRAEPCRTVPLRTRVHQGGPGTSQSDQKWCRSTRSNYAPTLMIFSFVLATLEPTGRSTQKQIMPDIVWTLHVPTVHERCMLQPESTWMEAGSGIYNYWFRSEPNSRQFYDFCPRMHEIQPLYYSYAVSSKISETDRTSRASSLRSSSTWCRDWCVDSTGWVFPSNV